MKKRFISILLIFTMLFGIPSVKADDEITGSGETYVIHEAKNPKFNDRDTYIINLGKMHRIDKVELSQYISSVNGIKSYEVWMSSDGENYMQIGTQWSDSAKEYSTEQMCYDIPQTAYAKSVKVIINKSEYKNGYLISDLKISGGDGIEQRRIDADAEYTYWTQTPYRTADDIRIDDPDCKKLMDGDTKNAVSTSEKWATVVVDLKNVYQIGDVDIYSLAKDNYFLEGCDIRYSLNGEKWFSYTYYLNDNDITGDIVKSSFSGMPGRNARFLKIIMQSQNSKIAVSEININGYPVESEATGETEQVPLRVEMKNYLLAYLDWSTYNSENVESYKLYVEKTPFTSTEKLTPSQVFPKTSSEYKYRYATQSFLEPETTYYFAITPVDKDGNERKDVKPVRITTQGVLGGEVRDTFNITNHPNYGGGGTVKFGSYHDTSFNEALRLYDELGAANKTRCWWTSQGDLEYAKKGVSTMNISPNNAVDSIAYGNYVFSKGNEPEFGGVSAKDLLADMKKYREELNNLDKRTVFVGPVLGGGGITQTNYLKELYALGGTETKFAFDVFDTHLYCKYGDKNVPGLPAAVPEQMFIYINDFRDIMRQYDDEDKPIICTEVGYSTMDTLGYQTICTYEKQRDYIVRTYLNAIALDIKEAWLYNYHDDYLSANEGNEAEWGLINYFCVPKDSYYGFYNMYQQLKNTDYLGNVNGVQHPYYGNEFFDETKNKHISVVWAANDKDTMMQFQTLSGKDEKIEIIGCDSSFKVIETENGKATVDIGRGPKFIYSENGIKSISIKPMFEVKETSISGIQGRDVSFVIDRKQLGRGKSGKVIATGLSGGLEQVGESTFTAEQQQINATVHIPLTAEGKYSFELSMMLDDGIVQNFSVEIDVSPSIKIEFTPEIAEFGNWKQWKLAVKCKNIIDVPLSADMIVLKSEGIDFIGEKRISIENLEPGEEKTYYFDISNSYVNTGAVASFALTMNGVTTNIDKKLDFSFCVNDGKTPALDGVISPGEWDTQVVDMVSDTKLESDLSGKLYRKWDEDYLYVAVDVIDDIHFPKPNGELLWEGDGLQIGLDPWRKNGVGTSSADYMEMGFCDDLAGGLASWAWYAVLVVKRGRPVPVDGISKRTDDGHTIYELRIPWSYMIDIGSRSPQAHEGDIFGFAFVINDCDGTERSYISYRLGIAEGKDANKFEDMILVKK